MTLAYRDLLRGRYLKSLSNYIQALMVAHTSRKFVPCFYFCNYFVVNVRKIKGIKICISFMYVLVQRLT